MINKPFIAEYNPFFSGYISQVIDLDIDKFLVEQLDFMVGFFSNLPQEKIDFAYAEGKWTIKQVLRHIIDAERVFAYRVMVLSRQDKTSLPGFDEGDYMENSNDSNVDFKELIKEFSLLRQANILMIQHIRPDVLTFMGTVNNSPTSTRAMIYVLAGHAAHHMKVIKQRYF